MKKVSLSVLLILIISCMMLISCSPDVADNTPSEPENTVTRSLETLEAGGKIELDNVGEETEINLSGFTLEDGVYIELVNSKGKTIKSTKSVNEELIFVREDGSLIPIPDENGNIKMKGKDLGVGNGTKVIVNKLLHLNDDFSISQAEYEDDIQHKNRKMAEEYYYFNLRDSGLKSSEVVILTSGHGAHNVRLLQRGMLTWDIRGVLNMSSYKQSGFAINMYVHFADDFPTQQMGVFILNPIDVKDLTESNAHVLDSKINVIKVRTQNSGKKIVIKFDNEVSVDVLKNIAFDELALGSKARYFDGENRSVTVIPEFDLVNKTITFHLGTFNDEFIFNLDWNETDYVPGTARVYVDADEDWNDSKFTDISDTNTAINIASQPGKLMTWAFKSDRLYNIYVDNHINTEVCREQNEELTRIYFADTGIGGGQGCLREFLFATDSYGDVDENKSYTGYILIDCTGIETSENIITLQNAENMTIDCDDVIWDPESNAYKCTDPLCPKLYSMKFVDACKKNIFEGLYFDEDNHEFGVFKDIKHDVEGFKVGSISGISSHGTGGNAVDGRRYEGIILSDGSESWIEFRLQEIKKESNGVKKIVYDVTSYVNTDNPVRVTYTMCNHDWTSIAPAPIENDDEHYTLKCKNCDATRLASVIKLHYVHEYPDEHGYIVELKNVPISIYQYVHFFPDYSILETFSDKGNIYYEPLEDYGVGDYDISVFGFSPVPGKTFDVSVPVEIDGNYVYTISFAD